MSSRSPGRGAAVAAPPAAGAAAGASAAGGGVGGGVGGGGGGSRCLLILQRCLAIQLQKVALVQGERDPQPSEYWMYDSGYLLFQGFLEANLKCFWNASLLEAMRLLEFQGYVAPGVLLVTASACALEVVRSAWARNVLKPPSNYVIAVVGDVEDCLIQPLQQGQFTPLPEALCWVILDLTSSGQAAVLERIRSALQVAFPDMQEPSSEIVYDALAKLMADRKVYQTSQGYFVETPERRRRREPSHGRRPSRSRLHGSGGGPVGTAAGPPGAAEGEGHGRPMLFSTEEALAMMHGEMATIRDGDITHQAVQTNLADVICGGNPNDKVLYPRATRRSSSFPLARLERRHSLRLFGSSKRLSNSLSRCGSLRHLPYKLASQSDSSSSTESPSMLVEPPATKKGSLLSRLFRRSGRKRGASAPPAPLSTFSAQFPPTEWFNPRVAQLQSVGTQTRSSSGTATASCYRDSLTQSHGTIAPWTDEEASSRAATLPRRHRRHASGDSATSLTTNQHSQTALTTSSSTPRSSRRHRSPSQSSTIHRRSSSSNSTSRTSVLPHPSPSKTSTLDAHNQSPSQSSVVTSNHSTPNKSSSHQNGSVVSFSSSKSVSSSPCKSLTSHSNRNSPSHMLLSSNRPSPSKMASSSPPVIKSNSSSRHSSPAKGKLCTGNGLAPHSSQKAEPSPSSKSSITLQVSATNRSSPPSTSGYSSHCQSSTGRSSVLSTASSAPFQESPAHKSVTVTNGSPTNFANGQSSTTTTTTINGSNTKIYVQQQNSPVRSVITFENGMRNNVNGCGMPSKDIIIINGGTPQQNELIPKDVASANSSWQESPTKQLKPRLERPTSLYSPREVLKVGAGTENSVVEKPIGNINGQDRRRFPSVESLNCSEVSSGSKDKLTNNCNFNNSNKSHHKSNEILTSPILKKNEPGDASTIACAPLHPNAQPPSTPTSNDPTMNNARILPAQTSPALPAKNKDGLNIKNFLRNESLSNILASNGDALKNNCMSNPSSPTKSFDSFGGSYGNLYIEQLEGNDKLLSASMKNLEEKSNSEICPYPSLNDLTVHFKSIAAQKILKGVSINSIDTLVEVNMAAAEKQNNCDVTIHTDFGVV